MKTNWSTVRLKDVLSQYKEYVYSLEKREYPKLSVKLYGKGCIVDGSVNGSAVKMKRHQLAKAGQVILSEIWAKRGAIGFVPLEGHGALVTSHFFLFDVNESSIDVDWLGWLIKANYFEAELSEVARGTTGYAAIRPKQFLELTIPLPPLEEQRLLVATLDAFSSRIEEARRIMGSIEAEIQVLLDSCRDTIFAADREWPKIALGRSDIQINPETFNPKAEPDEEFTYIEISSVEKETGIITGARRIRGIDAPSRARRLVREGDIIIATVRPYLKAFAKVPPELDGAVCSTGFAVLRCAQGINAGFLLEQAFSDFFVGQCMELATGAHYPAINLTNLKKVQILVPPLAIQWRIIRFLGRLRAQTHVASEQQLAILAMCEGLQEIILDEAFAGELKAKVPLSLLKEIESRNLVRRKLFLDEVAKLDVPSGGETCIMGMVEVKSSADLTKLLRQATQSDNKIEAKELWRLSRLKDIDTFYAYLKAECMAGNIVERREDHEVYLELSHEAKETVD